MVNVSDQSSQNRDLLAEGFTSYALRNGKQEGFLVNIDQLPVLTSGGTERWASVYYVPKRRSKREFVKSTTGWRRRNIIELRVE